MFEFVFDFLADFTAVGRGRVFAVVDGCRLAPRDPTNRRERNIPAPVEAVLSEAVPVVGRYRDGVRVDAPEEEFDVVQHVPEVVPVLLPDGVAVDLALPDGLPDGVSVPGRRVRAVPERWDERVVGLHIMHNHSRRVESPMLGDRDISHRSRWHGVQFVVPRVLPDLLQRPEQRGIDKLVGEDVPRYVDGFPGFLAVFVAECSADPRGRPAADGTPAVVLEEVVLVDDLGKEVVPAGVQNQENVPLVLPDGRSDTEKRLESSHTTDAEFVQRPSRSPGPVLSDSRLRLGSPLPERHFLLG